MKWYLINETTVRVCGYEVLAENKQDALKKINENFGSETKDILRTPEYDKVISRDYEIA